MSKTEFLLFKYYTDLYVGYDQSAAEIIHPNLIQDFGQVKVVMDWGFKHEREAAVHLVESLRFFFNLYVSYEDRLKWLSVASQVSRRINSVLGEANSLFGLGDIYRLHADYAQAEAHYLSASYMNHCKRCGVKPNA